MEKRSKGCWRHAGVTLRPFCLDDPPCGTLRLVGPAGVDLRKLSARLLDPVTACPAPVLPCAMPCGRIGSACHTLPRSVRPADGRKAFRLGRYGKAF